MSDTERENNIKPPIGGIVAEFPQLRNGVDAGRLDLAEFDDWLKHNIVKYRYPLLGVALVSTGLLAYRFVRKIFRK